MLNQMNMSETDIKDVLSARVRTVQVALATAIIRCAPPGVSGEEHARRLCGRFRRAQLHWKESNSRLRQELLSTRQELLLRDARPCANSEELNPVESVGEEEDKDSPIFPTPPCSTLEKLSPGGPSALGRHAHFLHVFLSLRDLDATPIGVNLKLWETSVRETVLKAVSLLQDAIQPAQGFSLPLPMIHKTAQAVLRYVDSGPSLWPEISEAIGSLVQTLLVTMLDSKQLNPHRYNEELRGLVSVLSGSVRLRTGVTRLLAHYIIEYGRFLSRVRRGQARLEPHTFEAMFHVIWCLEQAVRQEREALGLDCGGGKDGGREEDPRGGGDGAKGDKIGDCGEDDGLHGNSSQGNSGVKSGEGCQGNTDSIRRKRNPDREDGRARVIGCPLLTARGSHLNTISSNVRVNVKTAKSGDSNVQGGSFPTTDSRTAGSRDGQKGRVDSSTEDKNLGDPRRRLAELRTLRGRLEETLLQTVEAFPLFSMYVWELLGLLDVPGTL